MPLVSPEPLYRRAMAESFALGAFNTQNLETTLGIVEGLASVRAPGIVQVTERTIAYAGLALLRDLVRDAAASVAVPLVLHLDHGMSPARIREALDAGFLSVMFDGSRLPLEENIARTRAVVGSAHAAGAWVEGEVGVIGGKDGSPDEGLTEPSEAVRFVEETGVDALAVAVGSLHGAFRGREGIRFDRLAAIRSAVPCVLVLHGASGLPEGELRRAVAGGVTKVNVDTELRESFHDATIAHREGGSDHTADPRDLLQPAREIVSKIVAAKAVVLGAAGKA